MVRSGHLLLVIALAGCSATQGEHARDDAGRFALHCNQSSLRWNTCYEKAARLCGENGYRIVSEDGGEMPTATTNIHEVPVIGNTMVIRCNR